MPADFVNKLARMFQDIKVSEDLNSQFKEEYRANKGSLAGESRIFTREKLFNNIFGIQIQLALKS
jgi:hypothetical protein